MQLLPYSARESKLSLSGICRGGTGVSALYPIETRLDIVFNVDLLFFPADSFVFAICAFLFIFCSSELYVDIENLLDYSVKPVKIIGL